MQQAPVVLGFSLTPQGVSAVMLYTQGFKVVQSTYRSLPEGTFSADGKNLLSIKSLVQTLQDIKEHLGNPALATPVYLAVTPHIMETHPVDSTVDAAIQEELRQLSMDPEVFGQSDTHPVIRYTSLGHNEQQTMVGYSIISQKLIEDLEVAFAQVEMKVTSVDLIPLTILRAMGASGVLDAMLKKLSADGVWGVFGQIGTETWVLLWQGTHLLEMGSFSTPKTKAAWRNQILKIKEVADVPEPEIWLSWTENAELLPSAPTKLELGGPIRDAFLGPLYESLDDVRLFPALGAALKAEILFPLGWDFYIEIVQDDPEVRIRQQKRTFITKVLPRRITRACWMVIAVIMVLSMWLWFQNDGFSKAIEQKNAQFTNVLTSLSASNDLYLKTQQAVSQKVVAGSPVKREGVKLDSLKITEAHDVIITGHVFDKASFSQFESALKLGSSEDAVRFSQLRSTIEPSVGNTTQHDFEVFARVMIKGAETSSADTGRRQP